MVIRDLSTHSAPYVTIPELADYWAVSRQQIYKWIEARTLSAIRLGSRLYRVPTQAALDFERDARTHATLLGERLEGASSGRAGFALHHGGLVQIGEAHALGPSPGVALVHEHHDGVSAHAPGVQAFVVARLRETERQHPFRCEP